MAPAHIVHQIKNLLTTGDQESPPTTELPTAKIGNICPDDQHRQMLNSLLEIDGLPPEYRKLLESQRELNEHISQVPSHWEDVKSRISGSKDYSSKTFYGEFRETEALAQAIRDAFEADYKYYARGYHLSTKVLSHSREVVEAGDEVIESVNQQVILFEIFQEFAMTNTWVASVRYTGLRLMFLNPDDDLGNLVLNHEMKRRTSDIILSTTTVVETVGQTLLEIHRDQVNTNERLVNIIDMLAADDLISAEEKDAMHSVRDMRNRIAHDMEDRTTLDWVEDFEELVLNCFSVVGAIDYPVQRRLETELPPKVAEEYLNSFLPTLEEDIEWESAVRDFD